MSKFNLSRLKELYLNNKDLINKIALPLIVVIAILFFWIYGSDEGNVEVTDAAGPDSLEEQDESAEEGENTSYISEQCYVDIGGEVHDPGVYLVSAGSRVFQVIEEAGGLTGNAFTDSINMAEEVYDGEKIIVPSEEDPNGQIVHDGAAGDSAGAGGIVNINTADADTLMTLPGIGPSKAQAIIDYRDSYGLFNTPEDLKNVSGIGEKSFESIKDYIRVY